MSKPPSCNTGVERSSDCVERLIGENAAIPHPATGHTGLIDYLRVTFHGITPDDILPVFSVEGLEWVARDFGGRFYGRSFVRGGVKVFFGGLTGSTAETVHVEATGEGCRELERDGVIPEAGWVPFLAYLLKLDARFSRLDVALDDRSGLLRPERLSAAVRCGQVATRVERKNIREQADGAGGYTLYVGARTSPVMLRMYDKNAQQGLYAVGPCLPWLRVELELKDERAQRMVEKIASGAEDFGQVVAGVIASHVRFVEGGEKLVRHRQAVGWWSEWLAGVQAVKLRVAPAVRSIARKVRWIAKQVLPSLATLSLAHDIGVKRLWEWIFEGRRQLREADLALVVHHNRKRLRMPGVEGVFRTKAYWWGRAAGASEPVMRLSAAVQFGGFG